MEEINDPDGAALKTSYDYHESSKLQKKIVNPNGVWKHTLYNDNNYITTEIESYKNTPYSTSMANGLSTINEYNSHDSADIVNSSDGRPRTITQKVNGTVVSKRFFFYNPLISKRQTVRGKSALAFPVYHFFGILKSFFCSKRKISAATHLRFENSAFRIFSAKRFGNLSSKEFLFTKPARRATAFLVEKGGKIERIVES